MLRPSKSSSLKSAFYEGDPLVKLEEFAQREGPVGTLLRREALAKALFALSLFLVGVSRVCSSYTFPLSCSLWRKRPTFALSRCLLKAIWQAQTNRGLAILGHLALLVRRLAFLSSMGCQDQRNRAWQIVTTRHCIDSWNTPQDFLWKRPSSCPGASAQDPSFRSATPVDTTEMLLQNLGWRGGRKGSP